ncbi:MFS transporter [Roseinatronobacter bogoriensis]|uniref:MFS transporter n=1 Tax=Roseinatronobacter bogoriensis subsp. barguzinensis TaxID=441209 RepID=A0A2K8K8K4_9RHOB|nr:MULTISPECIES: MFS transporter [Rhodobaca]ATX65774.1 MFS transporter [Rhodobaca barguzinensis]MBB4208270.1 MFS family permease [Rhodobaca bogoriensis DSM 18756]TDW38911.1 putative MFS family arabinose efflux permease [Rhodobaca barguzinensis]TDY68906.1 putative MFS family arabinose efflux permease [Rhodobaca bogoriensis DSM 18756]
MKLGLFFLVVGYLLSQFYRSFLAVLAGLLQADVGVTADDLALSSGLWFLVFAAMQLPVGWALDRFGPRRTTAIMLGFGGTTGAVVFAVAQNALHLHLAMALLGIGCAPVLMASYYIFARSFPPAIFATLAGAVIGFGSLGNILGALPMAWAAEAFGWRASILAIAGVTALVSVVLWVVIQDPPKAEAPKGKAGNVLDLLRIPAIWFLIPLLIVNYAPAAGLRGLWVGPYYTDVYAASATGIGQVTLLMAIAMIAGNFAYGPLDRLLGTRKWVILGGNMAGAACLGLLWLFPLAGVWQAALLFAAVGFFGASFPMMMAHGRSFIPPHLTGRGVTLLNLFSIGGVGVLQVMSGRVHALAPQDPPEMPYQALFLFFGLLLLIGCIVYLFSTDRTD